MHKKFIPLLISTVLSISVNSQCSIEKKIESHSTTYFAGFELIYKNTTDVENGVMEYNLRVALHKDTSKSVPDTYLLECSFISNRVYNEIQPRKINLIFENGSAVELDARTVQTAPNTPATYIARLYLYELSSRAVTLLKNYGLYAVQFIDHRENTMIRANPYKGILKEQIICIEAISSGK